MAKNGQNLRVFVSGKCIAVATSCSFHVALDLEESTTKDSNQGYKVQDCVGKSWDVSCEALYDPELTDATAITPAELMEKLITEAEPKVTLKWDVTTGDKNRTAKGIGYTGSAWINDGSVSAANRTKSSATFQFQGDGPLAKIPVVNAE